MKHRIENTIENTIADVSLTAACLIIIAIPPIAFVLAILAELGM